MLYFNISVKTIWFIRFFSVILQAEIKAVYLFCLPIGRVFSFLIANMLE